MKIKYFGWVVALAFVFLQVSIPGAAMALERWLVPDNSQCAADITVNPCHSTLADAISQASPGDTIKIFSSTTPYLANVTLTKSVTIFGEETAKTRLSGSGGTVITVSGVNSATMEIRNLTFTTASTGILAQNASSFNVKNNIFEVGNTTTAIQVADTSAPSITNNVFYQNGTAILSTPSTLNIINNIFNGNALAISANVVKVQIKNNLFFQNTSIGGPADIVLNDPVDPDSNVSNQDPHFVNPSDSVITNRDFHLISKPTATGNTSAGANSINGVSPPDVGVYGGSLSDTIPFLVSDLTGTALSDSSVDLAWSLNKCYMVTGYNVYYNMNKTGPPYTNGPVDAGNVASFTLDVSGALTSTPTLSAPSHLTAEPVASGTLKVSWWAVSGATGYEVSFKKTTDSTFTVLPVVANPPVTLSGLDDPTPSGVPTYYDISVRAFYQASVYAAVKSYYAPSSPSKEALDFSNETHVSVGTPTLGVPSIIQEFPEPLVPYPNLPNKGCFIATAAYGYYSAPQVQALRKFRDQYLVTNAVGKAFVEWYYRYGPIGAEFIIAHPWLKPLVRVALLPAVGFALFLTRATLLTMLIVLISVGLPAGYLIYKSKFVHSGGVR